MDKICPKIKNQKSFKSEILISLQIISNKKKTKKGYPMIAAENRTAIVGRVACAQCLRA
jgi:hypothetical protein